MPTATKAALLILVFSIALIVRLQILFASEAAQTLPRAIGTTTTVAGTVSADPDVRDTGVRVNLTVATIGSTTGSGMLLAVLPKGTNVAYGDMLAVRGSIEAPDTFVTDTGRVFDYPGYLRVRGVSALIERAQVVSRAPSGFTVQGALFSAKHAFERSIERILPAQDASLLEGIVLGERRGISDALTAAFIIASLIHVVVLSGYNISIVAEATLRGLGWLPKTARYALGIALMILFIIMTGGGSTSVRAGIMALIAIFARYLNRQAVAMRSLAFAAAMLVLWNPLVVVDDPSFILSFLATFGLITLAPWVESRLPRALSAHPQIRSIAASTIAVQLYLLPALLYYTGIVSIAAVPANVLTLPLIPFAMLTGFLAGALGSLHPLLGLVPALLSDLVLRWLTFIAQTAASLPFTHATVPAFPAWVAVLIYVPLTLFALRAFIAQERQLARSVLRTRAS